MGLKVEGACGFAEATGKVAAIGALKDLPLILVAKQARLFHQTLRRSSGDPNLTWLTHDRFRLL
jgi:hypothetical protein